MCHLDAPQRYGLATVLRLGCGYWRKQSMQEHKGDTPVVCVCVCVCVAYLCMRMCVYVRERVVAPLVCYYMLPNNTKCSLGGHVPVSGVAKVHLAP